MSDNTHMRQFTATPTVEELEAEIERLNEIIAKRAENNLILSDENYMLWRVIDVLKVFLNGDIGYVPLEEALATLEAEYDEDA